MAKTEELTIKKKDRRELGILLMSIDALWCAEPEVTDPRTKQMVSETLAWLEERYEEYKARTGLDGRIFNADPATKEHKVEVSRVGSDAKWEMGLEKG